MTVDPKNLDSLISQIEKKYKEELFHKGSEIKAVPRIPFDSISMNIATGGGVPMGRISRFFGAPGACKTISSLQIAKNAQNIHIIAEEMTRSEYDPVKKRGERLLELFPKGCKIAYYNAEGSYDDDFAKAIGVNTDDLLVVEGGQIEKIGGIIEATLSAVHIHIIDSLSHCYSIDELNSNIEDWHRGIKARSWNKVLDHVSDKKDNYENAIILIDQIRIDQTTGAEYAPGGTKLEHNSACTLHFKKGKGLFEKNGSLVTEYPRGPADSPSKKPEEQAYEVSAKVKKSKVGKQFRWGLMRHKVGTAQMIPEFELASVAQWLNVVEVSGSWITLPGGEKIQGIAKLEEQIKNDPDLRYQIINEALNYMCINP